MSMPVTSLDLRGRNNLPDLASVLGHIDTTGYLFGEEDKEHNTVASPDHKAYLQMSNTDDKFPILVRRDGAGNGTKLSASSAALDLALSQSPGPDAQPTGWQGYRHRQAQQSLPTTTLRKASQVDDYDNGPANGNIDTTPNKNMANNRRSVEFNLSPEPKRSSFASPTNGMPKLTQSYSASDVPTLKNNGAGVNGTNGGFNTHAEQHLHNHNANLGRIPFNAMNNRHSREISSGYKDQDYRHGYSGLHASAAPFGPTMTSAPPVNGVAGTVGSPTMSQYATTPASNAPYYGYGMSMLNGAMNGLNMGPGPQMGAPPAYSANGMFGGGNVSLFNPYATYGPGGRVQDSQARVIQSRRLQNDANRFMNYDLKTMPRSEIYSLCKDQHGCRFLQKKLEERNAENLQIIFDETAPHVVELMTDPFGNYLCQKLLEFANDEQRNTLVRNACPAMVSIALNQHGTRALQKMIEFISTEEQVRHPFQTLIQFANMCLD
jgi:hypothetical protein